MNIVKATEKYEEWLAQRIPLIEEDLEYKHERMAEDAFEFMRATFYRWMQLWPETCSKLDDAPSVLAVGDLHTDNFGTWRDIEGRLVWGINDFDEAYQLPYTADLVRLATSAYMAIINENSSIDITVISENIITGYKKGLKAGGQPFVLAENNTGLRDLMLENLKDPEKFWNEREELPTLKEKLPEEAKLAIENTFPKSRIRYRIVRRTTGLGSLGRRRYLALFKIAQSRTCREAKELTASACLWALGEGSNAIFYSQILKNAVRSPDPFLQVRDRWVVRRLSADYSRLEIESLSDSDLKSVLQAMGWETANVHLGSSEVIKEVQDDLKNREKDWLSEAVEDMLDAIYDDFKDWQGYWQENDGQGQGYWQKFDEV